VQAYSSKSYRLITAPAAEPVSVSEAKTFLRVDGSEEDTLIGTLIASARRAAEEYMKRALITQTWELTMDGFVETEELSEGWSVGPTPDYFGGGGVIQLSRQPIRAVVSIKTYNLANTESTVSAGAYTLDVATGQILLNSGQTWPSDLRDHCAVKVNFTAGYGDAGTDVPAPIRQGIQQHVMAMYESRMCADMPAGSMALYDSFRTAEAFGAW